MNPRKRESSSCINLFSSPAETKRANKKLRNRRTSSTAQLLICAGFCLINSSVRLATRSQTHGQTRPPERHTSWAAYTWEHLASQ